VRGRITGRTILGATRTHHDARAAVPLYDTTAIHAEAAITMALSPS